MTFLQKLDKIIKKNNSLLCVGLDNGDFKFNKKIIDQTYDLVCAYKPNSAFYEAHGAKGIEELKKTFNYIQKNYPNIPTVLDAKRGDIGNTNEGYVKFAFDYLNADAITLHPYLGKEALNPFLEHKEKGCFILCKTSNPGSGEFQNFGENNNPLYLKVAKNVYENWNYNKNCCLVVGATYPRELAKIRKIVGNMIILVPGIGAQGGDLGKTLKAGLTKQKSGLIINSSRGIIFAENPRTAALTLRNEINKFR